MIPKNPDEFDTGCYVKVVPFGDEDDPDDADKGFTYRGLVTSTVSGRTCQNWLDKHPHEIPDDLKPDNDNGLGNHNFCRNPDQSWTSHGASPWIQPKKKRCVKFQSARPTLGNGR